MRNLMIMLVSVAGGAGLTAASLSAASLSAETQRGPNSPGGRALGCSVFQDANYQGRREFAPDGDAADFVGPAWNDQASSLRCDPGCRITVYEHADFQGRSETFGGDVAFVGPRWNDRISAWRIACRR